MTTEEQITPTMTIDQAAERIKNIHSDDVSIDSMHRHGKGWVVLFWRAYRTHPTDRKQMSEPTAGCAYLADDFNDTVVRCV
jgi:hypothetical protein